MTTSPRPAATGPAPVEPADRVAEAALAVPGVVGLHAGSFGEVGTYLPGRRVAGVRLGATSTEVHVSVRMGARIPEVAAAIVGAVGPLVGTPVEVVVEDVVPDGPAPA